MAPLKPASRELTLYIGTYTSSKSEVIYIYRIDRADGEVTPAGSVKSENPSFLTMDPAKRYLYAVNEKPEGTVSAFAINRRTGELSLMKQQSSHGADPCHVSEIGRAHV